MTPSRLMEYDMKLGLWLAASSFVMFGSLNLAHADSSIRVIAYEGQQVPGAPAGVGFGHAPGASVATFPYTPIFGNNGDISFLGHGFDLATNADFGGLFRSTATPGGWTLASPYGATMTAPDGNTYSQVLRLGRAGAAFVDLHNTSSGGLSGYFTVDPNVSVYLPGTSLPVPGSSPATTQTPLRDRSSNRAGDAFFVSWYLNTVPTNTLGYFFRDSGGVHLIQGNVPLTGLGKYRSAVTDDGRFVLQDGSTIRAGTPAQNQTIFGGTVGVPGFPANTQAGIVLPDLIRTASLPVSSHGSTAFVASVTPPSQSSVNVLFAGPFSSLAPVGKQGQQAPGLPAGVLYNKFGPNSTVSSGIAFSLDALVSDAGHITYRAGLSGTGVTSSNSVGVFAGLISAPTLIARIGDASPGGAGLYFKDIAPYSINDSGQVLLWAILADSTSATVGSSLLLFTPGGSLQTALSTGDIATLAPGDTRIIAGIFPANPEYTQNSTLSADGRMAVGVEFSDGTEALLVVQVPAPASNILLLGITAMRCRRQSRV